MSKNQFKKKVVVITGATGGIGRALACRFARAGAHIVLLDLDPLQLSALANQIEKLGSQAFSLHCDVTHQKECVDVMQQIIARYGGIDVLINNAGITHRSAFIDTDIDVFKRVMDVNFYGSLYCTKAALPSLIEKQGLIITLSSLSGFAPLPYRSGYNASKHALHGLFDTLRNELHDIGVDVMMVCPGFTATDMHKNALHGDGSTAKKAFSVVGKVTSPNSVADSIYEGAVKGKRLLILSNITKRARLLFRLSPSLYDRVMSRNLSRQYSSKE